MKTIFEQEENILHESSSELLPAQGTFIKINDELYEVDYCTIDLSRNYITVELLSIN